MSSRQKLILECEKKWRTYRLRSARVNFRQSYEVAMIEGPDEVFLELTELASRQDGDPDIRIPVKKFRLPFSIATKLLRDLPQLSQVALTLKGGKKPPRGQ